jgi:hypothetical protein
MKPNRAARIAALILALAGLASMLAAGIVATRTFTVTVRPRHYQCGSILFPKDPRNKVSTRKAVPLAVRQAENRCSRISSNRTHTATTFLLVGVVPLLIVLTLPALTRRSRRSRARRRIRL